MTVSTVTRLRQISISMSTTLLISYKSQCTVQRLQEKKYYNLRLIALFAGVTFVWRVARELRFYSRLVGPPSTHLACPPIRSVAMICDRGESPVTLCTNAVPVGSRCTSTAKGAISVSMGLRSPWVTGTSICYGGLNLCIYLNGTPFGHILQLNSRL